MRKATFSFALLAIASLSSAQADLKPKLTKIYDELNTYMKNKQVDKAEKLMKAHGHPDFLYVHLDGRKQKTKEMLAEMKMSLGPQTEVVKSVSKLGKLTLKGNTAVIETTGEYAMKMPFSDGKPHLFAGKSVTQDTWVKVGSAWKLKMVKVVKEDATMDGKPFKM